MPDKSANRIIIVDDEPALMKSLCNTLGDHGYETTGFISGEAALAALSSTHFDLLLTDLMMPGMDGIALLQAAQKLDSNLVSVLMTGAGSIAIAVKAMKAGALDFVTKPFELSVMLPVFSRALDMRRLRMENAALARRVAERTTELETANRALHTSEEQLRTLANWAVQAQENERAGLSLTLHDNITQLLCAVQVRSQTLADKLPAHAGPAKKEAAKLRKLLGTAAQEVECISRNLRPGVLDILGLVAALSDAGAEFAKRTGVSFTLDGAPLDARLPTEVELSLYRILQISLHNVEQHAHARHVSVCLNQTDADIQLKIKDDGIGFEPNAPGREKEAGGIGLVKMRERAAYVGGALTVKSARNAGTEINVRIPQNTMTVISEES